jgi:hypothetical protein
MNSKELIKKYVFLKMLCEDLDERSDRIRSVFQSHIGWKHGNIEVNFLTDPRVGSNGAGI